MAAELILGELTGSGVLVELPCDVPGVRARQTKRRGSNCTIEERLYECANGWAVGARRGGPLHLADAQTWELFVLTPQRIANGRPVGWIDDAALERAVRRLSFYREPWQSPVAAGTCSR